MLLHTAQGVGSGSAWVGGGGGYPETCTVLNLLTTFLSFVKMIAHLCMCKARY